MKPVDWDPNGSDVREDPRAAYDAMRRRCPVARDGDGGWTIFRHADVVRVLHDPATFSNVVSRHVAVPNGMDPPEHTVYRRLIEPCFSHERVSAFEPACRRIAAGLVEDACVRQNVELMSSLALPFAARAQCAYLGWPETFVEPLVGWTQRNQSATLAGDRVALAGIARELEEMVAALIDSRRHAARDLPPDLTDELIGETVDGRPLTLAELTSILRNWTMGEIGTIAASIGIVAHALADDVEMQYQLRRFQPLLPDAIDELLRLRGPLVGNRRTVTRQVEVGGRTLEPGDRLTINWVAANRDPEAFGDADAFRTGRDPDLNLLYGAGIHVCPGAPLARLELRVLFEELLAATHLIEARAGQPATLAVPPAGGFATLPLHLLPA